MRRRPIFWEGARNWSVYVWCCLAQCHLVLVGLIAKHFSGRGTGGTGWVTLFIKINHCHTMCPKKEKK